MNRKQFNDFIDEKLKKCPDTLRKGQAVFNIIDEYFHVARAVQFTDGVDCFYRDDKIEEFIDKAYKRYLEYGTDEEN